MMRYYRPVKPVETGETMWAVRYDCQAEKGDALEHVIAYTTDKQLKPSPRPNHYLIRVEAAALNPVDLKLCRFAIPPWIRPLPKVIGCDVAGTIMPHGDMNPDDDGHDYCPGTRVFAMTPILLTPWGTCAEYVAVPKECVAAMPSILSPIEAAGLPLVSLTVLQGFAPFVDACHRQGGSNGTHGKRVLITAGSSSVGGMAIQYCKMVLGMNVTALCHSRKMTAVEALGADVVLSYEPIVHGLDILGTEARHVDLIPGRYDVIFDVLPYIYEVYLLGSGKVASRDAYYIHIASSDPRKLPGDPGTDSLHVAIPEASLGYLFGNLKRKLYYSLARLFGWSDACKYDVVHVVPDGKGLEKIARWVEEGKLKPMIDRVFRMSEAPEAVKYLGQSHGTGKVILIPDGYSA